MLDEVYEKWDSFNDIQQSQITTALGGTRQRENILVAIENWDKVRDYAEIGANSAGTAMEKYDIVLESVSAKQEQLNAKTQEFYNNILSSDVISFFLELGKGFMDVMNACNGLLGKILVLTGAFIALKLVWATLKTTTLITNFMSLLKTIGLVITGTVTLNGAFLNLGTSGIGALLFSIPKAIIGLISLVAQFGFAEVSALGLKGALDLLNINPVMLAISALIAVVAGGVALFNHFNVTLEEQQQKLADVKQEYNEITDTLKETNDELAITQQRINELETKGSLSLVEEQELQNLKETNDELQRQIDLLEIQLRGKNKEKNKAFADTMKKDVQDEFEYNLDTRYDENGDPYDYISKGSYMTANAGGGTAIRSTESAYIEQQFNDLKRYPEKYDEIFKYLTDKYEDFEEASAEMEYIPNPTTEDEKAVNEWLDYINEFKDRYIIAFGDGEQLANLWSNIFSRDKFSEASNALQELANNGELTAQKIAELYQNNDKIREFVNYLITLGLIEFDADFITKYDKDLNGIISTEEALSATSDDLSEAFGGLANQIVDTSDSIVEANKNVEVSFDDLAESMSTLHDKYEVLKNAQEEYNEHGALSLDTLEDISEQYPDMAENIGLYLAGLMSEQELLEALGEAYNTDYENYENLMKSKLALSPQFYEGLTDAQKQNVQALFESYEADFGNFKTIEEAKLNFNAQIINKLSKRWKQYAGMTKDQLIAERNRLGSINDKKGGNWDGQAWDELNNAINDMNNFEKKLGNIVFEGVSFAPQEFIDKSLDIGNSSSKDKDKNSSSSSKEWWETQLEKLKKQLEYSEISMDGYINGIQKILGKLKKGSDAWREVNNELQKAKLENVENQFDRGEITIDQYISKLTELRKAYKQGTEGYKELTDKINDAKLDKTKDWLDDLEGSIDKIDNAINQLGDVNTDKERVRYAQLLSYKYRNVESTISAIQNELKKSNLTEEQRVELQEKLNDLLEEEVSIRDEIEDSVREYFENQKEYEEQEAELTKKQTLYNKEVELYGKKGKELFEWQTNQKINAINDEIEAREKEKEALDKINEREQLSNDLLEAKIALQNALNNKTTKILKKQEDGTWEYEYSVNMADVKEAQEAVADAEKALEDYDWEQSIQALRDEADTLQDSIDNLAKQYEEAEFWANREYEQTMNSIEKAYGDIDALVEKWMANNDDTSTKLTNAYKDLVKSNNTLQDKLVNLTTAIEGKYETVGDNGKIIPSFDTGGQIQGDGLAIVHGKERVLTPKQNAYFEQLIAKLPQLLKTIDITKFGGFARQIGGINNTNKGTASTVISKVECVFPNITTTDGLQQAILQLPRLALQKK